MALSRLAKILLQVKPGYMAGIIKNKNQGVPEGINFAGIADIIVRAKQLTIGRAEVFQQISGRTPDPAMVAHEISHHFRSFGRAGDVPYVFIEFLPTQRIGAAVKEDLDNLVLDIGAEDDDKLC